MSAETKPPPAEASAGQGRGRSIAVWAVLVLAGFLLLLSAFAVWIDRVALNTSVFTDTSTELLDDDAIRTAVANRAVDELFDNVDVQAEVEAKLPEDVQSLSGPVTAGIRQASYEIVDRALERPVFQNLFAVTLEATHETLVQVLEGGGSRVSTEGGEVTLDLQEIVRQTADRIGIGEEVADKLPADAGRIVILRSDELDTAQNAFQALKTLAWLLPLLTLVAFAVAVWLARERRAAVRGVGVVLAVVGVLGLLAVNLTGNYLVDNLVAQSEDQQAANNTWDILTDLLRSSFRTLVVVGLLFVVAAWLAGPGRRAVPVRRFLAPALRHRVGPYVVLAILALILLATGEVNDFTRLLSLIVLVALGAAWIELTRRQTMIEFPDAQGRTVIADARSRVSEWWEERRAAPEAVAAPPEPTPDVTAQLANLADLHARGELSDEEYAAAKARVLAGE
jgi:hypothetical protein